MRPPLVLRDFEAMVLLVALRAVESGFFAAAVDVASGGHGRDAHDRLAHQIAEIVKIVGRLLQEQAAGDLVVAVGIFPVSGAVGHVVGGGDVNRVADGATDDVVAGETRSGKLTTAWQRLLAKAFSRKSGRSYWAAWVA